MSWWKTDVHAFNTTESVVIRWHLNNKLPRARRKWKSVLNKLPALRFHNQSSHCCANWRKLTSCACTSKWTGCGAVTYEHQSRIIFNLVVAVAVSHVFSHTQFFSCLSIVWVFIGIKVFQSGDWIWCAYLDLANFTKCWRRCDLLNIVTWLWDSRTWMRTRTSTTYLTRWKHETDERNNEFACRKSSIHTIISLYLILIA